MPGRNRLDWFDMDESEYRASRVCRVLGNPKAFQVLGVIRELGSATPSEIRDRINRTMETACITLKTLREVDLVRYQREGRYAHYRLKSRHVEKIMDALASFVSQNRRQSR